MEALCTHFAPSSGIPKLADSQIALRLSSGFRSLKEEGALERGRRRPRQRCILAASPASSTSRAPVDSRVLFLRSTLPRPGLAGRAGPRTDTRLQVRARAASSKDTIPTPVVVIDQHSEEDATVVELEFGDRLGALLDTAAALRQLGLNVVKGKVATEASIGRNRFVITKGGKKVEDPELIEAIRGTIISKLLEFHPDSRSSLAMSMGLSKEEAAAVQANVPTRVLVETIDGGQRSKLYVETGDYPGLLLDIVKELRDLSIDVSSAEIDTEGLVAKDYFFITYRGRALSDSMVTVAKNALMYFLSLREIEQEESY